MRRALLAAVVGMALTGCQTAAPLVWMRMDGQRSAGNQPLEQAYYQARYECQAQSTQVAQGGPASITINQTATQTVNIGRGQGVDSSIPLQVKNPDIDLSAARARGAANDLFVACMNARGYRLGTAPAA